MAHLPVAALAVATCLLILPAVAHGIDVWSTVEEFSFGFLVLPISVGLLWWRRERIAASIGAGATGGLVVAALALAGYVLAQRVGINALAGLCVPPMLWGGAVYLWGWRAGREIAFPVAFMAFGLVLYRGLLDSVGLALQTVTAVGSGGMAHLLNLGVVRDGLVLRSDAFAFIVAEACSGMSSLVSLLTLATLWTYVARGGVLGKLGVVASVLPLVIIANTTRVTLVMLVASWHGQEVALGFFHGASSLILFGIALAGLLGVSRILRCKLPTLA